MNFKLNNNLFIFLLPMILNGQIENQVRDNNPGLFKNQRLYHSAPKPLFKSRAHNLDFVTDIPEDSVLRATLFFKTNTMEFYQEFQLIKDRGIYRFTYDPKKHPGTRLQYYFIIITENEAHGTPVNDKGELAPVDKLLIDPVEYFKQRARLNN